MGRSDNEFQNTADALYWIGRETAERKAADGSR